MPYTKPAQTGYALGLQQGEFVVKLDTTPVAPVAVKVNGWVDPDTGNIVAESFARVVKADGTDYLDVNGHPIKSKFHTSMDRAGIALLGGIGVFKKLMLLTVAGEDVTSVSATPRWVNAPSLDVLSHASIRTNIASAQDAAAATDLSALL